MLRALSILTHRLTFHLSLKYPPEGGEVRRKMVEECKEKQQNGHQDITYDSPRSL